MDDVDEIEPGPPAAPAPFVLRSPLESATPGGKNGLAPPVPLPLVPRPALRGEPLLEARGERGDCDVSESESSGDPTGIKGKSGEASRVVGREPGRLVCLEEAPSVDLTSSSSTPAPAPPPAAAPRVRSRSSSSSSSSSSNMALLALSRAPASSLPKFRSPPPSPSPSPSAPGGAAV